jgi:CubicO group peptidase (beta-lactamase class C family)
MKKTGLLLILFTLLYSCKDYTEQDLQSGTVFEQELEELKSFYEIPGMSALIARGDEVVFEKQWGFADWEMSRNVQANTEFPIASITKLYSAALVLKMAEKGVVILDDFVKSYLPDIQLDESIQVKHLLSHSSEGHIGKQFHYSRRFGLLSAVLEKATGEPFDRLLQKEILEPLQTENTYFLKNDIQVARRRDQFAFPFNFNGSAEPGRVEFGFSSSAGLATNPQELLRFSQALDNNSLLDASSTQKLFGGIAEELPYAFGLFKQKIEGFDVYWVYGQYDSYSSLLIKIPSKDLHFVLLANNNHLSDPARLIMGDLESSLFALSFLKNYLLNQTETPLAVEPTTPANTSLEQKIRLARALGESFMSRYREEDWQAATRRVQGLFEGNSNTESLAHINLLHALSFLKTVAFHTGAGDQHHFDAQLLEMANTLLEQEPNNPYLYAYLGDFYQLNGDSESAQYYSKELLQLSNFESNWYTQEAKARLLDQIAAVDRSLDGQLGFSVLHLESGQEISHFGGKRFPMQSVYKFPIALVMLQAVDRGEFSLDQMVEISPSEYIPTNGHSPLRDRFPQGTLMSLKEVLRYNISESDGTACDVLLRLLGGTKETEKKLHTLGITDMAIVTTEMVQIKNDTIQYQNWATPRGMNQLLRVFHQGEVLSKSSGDLLQEFMSVSTPWFDRRLKGQLPPDTKLIHKTGTSNTYQGLNRATNDVGIIELPNGEHLAVSAFIMDSRDRHQERENAIAKSARLAYNFWTSTN